MPFWRDVVGLGPKPISTKAMVERDERLDALIVSFHDGKGRLLDGSGGVDSLASGFDHYGSRHSLAKNQRPLLIVVAENGGRWLPGRGFVVREDAEAELLRALRTLPDSAMPERSPEVAATEVDSRRLEAVETGELIGDEKLEQRTVIETPEGVPVPPETVAKQAGRNWVRVGSKRYRRAKATKEEVEEICKGTPRVLTGDDVPYFLAKQLSQKGRKGRLGPRASKAQVNESPWLPNVDVETFGDEGRLRLGVWFQASNLRVPYAAAAKAKDKRFVPLGQDTWAARDRKAQEETRQVLTHLPGGKEESDGSFSVPNQALPLVQEAFSEIGTVNLGEKARALLGQLQDFERIEAVDPPKGLRATLRPYQRDGLNWLAFLHRYGLRGVLADDMGLGKTVQSLAAVLRSVEGGARAPSLVVCPASVVQVWMSEVAKWCDGLSPLALTPSSLRRMLQRPSFVQVGVASYQFVARNRDALQGIVWNYLILDEAHRIKNPTAQQTQACKSLPALHRLALTGTPIQNRLGELWSIFDFLMPGYLGTAGSFERTFEIPITNASDEGARAKLKRRIEPFKLRRLKAAVAKDLPQLDQQVVSVELLPEQRALYGKYLVGAASELLKADGGKADALTILEKLLRLRQIAAHPRLVDGEIPIWGSAAKLEELMNLLPNWIEDGQRVLVFSQWATMASLIREALKEKGIECALIVGSTATARRTEIVSQFQGGAGPPVLVISMLAGGEGLTLTAASYVVLFDRWWNPAVEDQAIARAHRIGQTLPVNAYILEAKDTIEERLADLLRRKKDLANSVISVDEAVKQVTRDELLELLREEVAAASHASAPVEA